MIVRMNRTAVIIEIILVMTLSAPTSLLAENKEDPVSVIPFKTLCPLFACRKQRIATAHASTKIIICNTVLIIIYKTPPSIEISETTRVER